MSLAASVRDFLYISLIVRIFAWCFQGVSTRKQVFYYHTGATYICVMEIITVIISFLEKHVNGKHLLILIGTGVAFWFGFEYNNAARNREESKLILQHAKEITVYHDSALSAVSNI